jgi:hypothetical protein
LLTALKKWLGITVGSTLAVVGFLTFPLPLPVGLPLLLIGGVLLLRHSSDARRLLVNLMRRYPALRNLLRGRRRRQFDKGSDPPPDRPGKS